MAKTMSLAQRVAWQKRIQELMRQRSPPRDGRVLKQVRTQAHVPPTNASAMRKRIEEIIRQRQGLPNPSFVRPRTMRPKVEVMPTRAPSPPASEPVQQPRQPASEAVITVDPIETQEAQYETVLSEAEEKSLRDAEFHGLTSAKGFNESDGDYGDLESDLGLEDF